MRPLRVAIVDDEGPARRKLRRFLEEEGDVEIVGEAADGRAAVSLIRERAPELVFLDVQMPKLDGFGVVDEVGVDAMPTIVFVTAFDEHALRAFEVHALGYLLKPFDPERFRGVLARARAQVARGRTDDLTNRLHALVESLGNSGTFLRRLLVHDEKKAFLLPVGRIDRIAAERNYSRLHAGGRSYRVRSSIGELAARLDPACFLRINRSEIVRLDAIKELHPWFHGDYRVLLTDGTATMWSRRYRSASAGKFAP